VFQEDTYTRMTTSTIAVMVNPASTIAEQLADDLARGLGISQMAFPYANSSEMERQLRST